MDTSLYLTENEKSLFDALSKDLQSGWSVETEQDVPVDTKMAVEQRLLIVKDMHGDSLKHRLEILVERLKKDGRTLGDLRFDDVERELLAPLLFLAGPASISILIEDLLKAADSPAYLQNIAEFTKIRRSLLFPVRPSHS